MFCTGGIRCEKASNFIKQKGFKNVFQLKGGIFNYLNKINIKKSLWKGECFVFDNRVSVKHKLSPGSYSCVEDVECLFQHRKKNLVNIRKVFHVHTVIIS